MELATSRNRPEAVTGSSRTFRRDEVRSLCERIVGIRPTEAALRRWELAGAVPRPFAVDGFAVEYPRLGVFCAAVATVLQSIGVPVSYLDSLADRLAPIYEAAPDMADPFYIAVGPGAAKAFRDGQPLPIEDTAALVLRADRLAHRARIA